ncbi:hypothetical protein FACS1894179_08570 [Bacteroidia bacterium]|nr:hypothetical protein FACS1894179_08570 [Bacteroidia bacterium]
MTAAYFVVYLHQNKTNTKRFAHFMKRLLYILLIPSLLIGFNSCGSGNDDDIIPPTPTGFTKDDLIGTWEVYYSKKDLTLNGSYYEGFRDPEMDGFRTKFNKEGDIYKFTNYNPMQEAVDKGTYDIIDGHIVFTVTEFNGRDTLYTTKQNVTNIKLSEGLMYVDYTFSLVIGGQEYKISDIRRLRNIATAPGAHPNVNKIMINFDDYVGTWQVYNYQIMVNGTYNYEASEKYLDKPNITTFKFYYNGNGQKVGEKIIYYPVENKTISTGAMPVLIVDDVIHLSFTIQLDDGSLKNDGIFLWITERKAYTDPETNKQTEMILDNDEFRDDEKPTDLYKILRYLKKVE